MHKNVTDSALHVALSSALGCERRILAPYDHESVPKPNSTATNLTEHGRYSVEISNYIIHAQL